MTDMILVGLVMVAIFALGAALGYNLAGRRLAQCVKGQENALFTLAGVVEKQSGAIIKSQGKSLDAALVTHEQQFDRINADRISDLADGYGFRDRSKPKTDVNFVDAAYDSENTAQFGGNAV